MKYSSFLFIASIALPIASYGQATPKPLQNLVESCARRIHIAHDVALSKWDNGSPVEDSVRESEVIQRAVAATEPKGLDASWVSAFFRAQIEANKVVQYELLAEWGRAGNTPEHPPVNLKATIRPELDQLQTQLIAELEEASALRAQPRCPAIVAHAVGDFLNAHHKPHESLNSSPDSIVDSIALDRALGTFCVR